VTYVFRPEPEPAERAALELALEQLLDAKLDEPSPYRSEWRRTALEEGVVDGREEDPDL
jgi:hypothetical protein